MNRFILSLLGLLVLSGPSVAASAIIYIDSGGCNTGSTTQCSGTTDSATATVSGAAATITCSAVAGPAAGPGCSLSGTPSLAGIATDGSQAIFVNCATNSNQKIFFINAIDDAADLVGTTVTPTGCTATSSDWGIGGRKIWTPAHIEAALRAGDTILQNNDIASAATTILTTRSAGDSTTGPISWVGKTGGRPKMTTTGAVSTIVGTNSNWHFENVEIVHNNATGNAISASTSWAFINVKVTNTAGVIGINIGGNNAVLLVASEITGGSSDCINVTTNSIVIIGSYLHGCGGNGITQTAASTFPGLNLINSIISTNTGRGILAQGAPTVQQNVGVVSNSVIYGNGNSGLEVADAESGFVLLNSIFMNNGDAANEFNVEWTAGTAQLDGYHGYNVFYHSNCQGSGTGGPACVSGLTTNSTELTSDPLFTNAGAGDFSLQSSSPAKQAGIPGVILGSTTTGFISMGAAQPQATAAGGRCTGC